MCNDEFCGPGGIELMIIKCRYEEGVAGNLRRESPPFWYIDPMKATRTKNRTGIV